MTQRPVHARDIPFGSSPPRTATIFDVAADGLYTLSAPGIGIVLEIDRLRWERSELRGELTVRCDLAGVATADGVLTSGSFNLSYVAARRDQAKYIAERAGVPPGDVTAALEELCHRVLASERVGKPSVLLHTFPEPTAEVFHDVDGIVLPQRHPSILFGDGSCGKSYVALMVLGILSRQGHAVMFCDWELDGIDHRARLKRLFGDQMPDIHYVRCDRPMSAEADRLRRIVAKEQIQYAVFDSVAFACDGAPESAESASAYFRAVRQLGPIGSLHLAHITKPSSDPSKADRSEYKPFGSTFWFNSARACWFIKRAEATNENEGRVIVGLYDRKNNLGPKRPSVGLELHFSETSTSIIPAHLEDVAELAKGLPLWRRMKTALTSGPLSVTELAEELDANEDSIRKAIKRMDMFTRIDTTGGRKLVALVDRRRTA